MKFNQLTIFGHALWGAAFSSRMNSPELRAWPSPRRMVAFACIACACVTSVSAQVVADDSVATAKAVFAQPQSGGSKAGVQVLKAWKASLPDHAVYYNLIAAPVASATPAALPTPAPLTARQLQWLQRVQGKKQELLFLSATVYDYRVTEVRWNAAGQEYRAYSNIDFNQLAGAGQIETDDTIYDLFMGLGNSTVEAVEAMNKELTARGLSNDLLQQIPSADAFSQTRSEYIVVQPKSDTPPPAEAVAAMDAIHLYYDANRATLAAAWTKREAERIAKLNEPKPLPTPVKDTVINFWPKKNSIFMGTQAGGTKQ
jgi:hypothetical protein